MRFSCNCLSENTLGLVSAPPWDPAGVSHLGTRAFSFVGHAAGHPPLAAALSCAARIAMPSARFLPAAVYFLREALCFGWIDSLIKRLDDDAMRASSRREAHEQIVRHQPKTLDRAQGGRPTR